MLHTNDWTLALLAPDPPHDGFEADPMFILAPQLKGGGGMLGLNAGDSLSKRFF
jgi:hypothetical protein